MTKQLFILGCLVLLSSCTKAEDQPKLNKVLEQEVHDDGIDSAIVHLAREMERDPEVSAFCHALAHSIGHAAYEKSGLDALQESNDICGSGYFHGVIEKHFENSADVLTTFKTLCNDRDGRCFHGLGHGLMYATENDLPQSVRHCAELDTTAQRAQCAEGVFMENFNTNDNFHVTIYKDPDNPFYPCNEQDHPYKGVCTFYAVRYYLDLHPHDHDGVIDWCGTVDKDVQGACYKGIGSALTKYHITTLDVASNACDKVPEDQRSICYDGIVSYIIVHHASPDKGKEWCDTLEEDLQGSCERAVEESRKYYEQL